MKKIFIFISLILLLSSCSSTPTEIIYDTSLPADKVTTIYWNGCLVHEDKVVGPVEYNGIKVDWEVDVFGFTPITIPAGETRFIINGKWRPTVSFGNVVHEYTYNNFELNYIFEAEKESSIVIEDQVTIYSGAKNKEKENLLFRSDIDWQ
jgi:hypothetical protein